MTLIERYLTWAVLCFISALIYVFFFMKQQDGKELSTKQKVLYAVLTGVLVPVVIVFVFKAMGIGIFSQAG